MTNPTPLTTPAEVREALGLALDALPGDYAGLYRRVDAVLSRLPTSPEADEDESEAEACARLGDEDAELRDAVQAAWITSHTATVDGWWSDDGWEDYLPAPPKTEGV